MIDQKWKGELVMQPRPEEHKREELKAAKAPVAVKRMRFQIIKLDERIAPRRPPQWGPNGG